MDDDVGNYVGTGTMVAVTPETMPVIGMVGVPAGRGGDPGGGRGSGGRGGSGNSNGGGCILQRSFDFYCEDIFVWYFYHVWGELARSHFPSHSCLA